MIIYKASTNEDAIHVGAFPHEFNSQFIGSEYFIKS